MPKATITRLLPAKYISMEESRTPSSLFLLLSHSLTHLSSSFSNLTF